MSTRRRGPIFMPYDRLKRVDVGSVARRGRLLSGKSRRFQAAIAVARRQDGVVAACAVAAGWIADVAVRPLSSHRQHRFDHDLGVETGVSPTVAARVSAVSAPTRYHDNVH